MNSTKIQKLNGVCKNPFTQSIGKFYQISISFQRNLQMIRNRFPLQQKQRIRSLLQQFDNNAETVCDLLREQNCQGQHGYNRSTIKRMSLQQENRLLKTALLRLNKRYMDMKKQVEIVTEQKQKLAKQNEKLILQNRFLLDKQQAGEGQDYTYRDGVY